jgi:hypothetical protein
MRDALGIVIAGRIAIDTNVYRFMPMKRLTFLKSTFKLRPIHQDRQRDRPFEAGATHGAIAPDGCQILRGPACPPEDGCDPPFRGGVRLIPPRAA